MEPMPKASAILRSELIAEAEEMTDAERVQARQDAPPNAPILSLPASKKPIPDWDGFQPG